MRLVFALSLFVLQHSAPGSGRPQPAPPAPAATARRGEGALLANSELSDLLFPVLDQLDDTSQNHKKKRILEIMPITQKGKNRKMPLLILASEIPTRKHKNIFSEDGKNKNKKQKNTNKNKSKISDSDEIINILSEAGVEFSSEHSQSDEEEDLHLKHSHETINETKKKKRTKENVSQISDEYSSKDYGESDEREIDNKHSSHKNKLEIFLNDLFKHLPHDEDEQHINHFKESSEQNSKPVRNTDGIQPKVDEDNPKIHFKQNSASYEIEEESQKNNVETNKVHKHILEHKHSDESESAQELTDTKESIRQKNDEVDFFDSNSKNSVETMDEDILYEVNGNKGDILIESQKETKTLFNKNIQSAEKVSEKLSQEISNEILKEDISEFSKLEKREEASVSVLESHELIKNNNLSADATEDESSMGDIIKSPEDLNLSNILEVNQSDQRDLADPNQAISDSLERSAISSSLDNSFADTYDNLSYEFMHDSLSDENSDNLTISEEASPNIKENSAINASIQDSMEEILEVVDDASHHRLPISATHYGYVFRNAYKGDVKEMHKTYKLSFRFNK